MSAQGVFNTNDTDLEPGSTTTLALMVTNLGDGAESFVMTPTGMAAAWTTIRPANITLFGGSQESVDVEISAPRLASTTAGPVALGVRIVPNSNPDEPARAETTIHISPTTDRRVTMLQPALRNRRRAVFEMMVENQGNTQASCRMLLVEPTGRLDGEFDPPAVGVEPGGSTLVRLKVRSNRLLWDRRARSIPFIVDADQPAPRRRPEAPNTGDGTGTGTSGEATSISAKASATFIQAPVLPERLWWRLSTVALSLGALAVLWFGLVRPEIRRSADLAVSRLPVPQATVVGGGPATGTGDPALGVSTTSPVAEGSAVPGEPFSSSLPSGAAQSETSTQTYTVPAGKQLLVKQLIVQNPDGDQGTATITIGVIPFVYNLVTLDGIDANQGFVDPLQVLSGETVTFAVTCASIGRAGAASCTPSATIIGRLLDV
jgi:hypothetical protein